VTRAIRKHLGDFLAVLGLFILAIGIGTYILSQERLRFPVVEEQPQRVKAVLENAQAVIPGQGQTVRIAGVKIGDIGKVDLEDGKAVVELQIDPEYKNRIKRSATALLRTKTGLKDMFLEVDPGTGPPLQEGQRIQVENTLSDVDPDEVLAALDADARDYLKLLVSGAGKGLKGRSTDLRETFRRFEPLHRDLAKVTEAVARRRRNLTRLVNRYGLLTTELAGKDKELTRLVSAGNATLEAFASEDLNISAAVSKLPGTLRQTESTLGKVNVLGRRLGPALDAVRPAFANLDEANAQVLPLAREGTPIVRDQIRPFARISQPYTKDLGEAARELGRAGPDLSKSFNKLNRLFNIAAYNPGGAQGLTGNLANDRRVKGREEGYLYWLAWVGQVTVGLFPTADAQGNFRRVTLGGANCSIIDSQLPPDASPVLKAQVQTLKALFGTAGVCVP
jgi:phospholipid/cholesterol/gamma-HCH transport system substrate-binding protein